MTDSRLLPKPEAWRYVRAAGFEVISNASDPKTRRILEDLARFRQAVGIVWPAIERGGSGRDTLILCGSHDRFAEFRSTEKGAAGIATVSLALRNRESSAVVLDVETDFLTAASSPNIDFSGDPASNDWMGIAVDHFKELHREYVRFLLGRIEPKPAPWLEEGLAQLLSSMEYDSKSIVFGRLPDMGDEVAADEQAAAGRQLQRVMGNSSLDGQTPAQAANSLPPPPGIDPRPGLGFNGTFTHGARIPPLARMFAAQPDSTEAVDPMGSVWAKECWAFVHLCLYGERGRYQKAFAEFVARSRQEPVTEDLFKQCFRLSYRQMEIELLDYAGFTNYRYYTFKAAKGDGLTVPAMTLRDATDAEVGRIQGEALAMAGKADPARYALIAPYVRGARDPELLAALGLDDLGRGDPARARPLLEAAVAGRTERARAYVELARMRLADALARANGGRIDRPHAAGVFALLALARQLPPPLAETFEVMAETLEHAEARPTERDLASINAGVSLFPGDSELVYRDALLHAAGGLDADAARLARYGAASAPDEDARRRFLRLAASLPGS